MASPALAARSLTYGPAGVTRPEDTVWSAPAGRRGYERTVDVGTGDECWAGARTALLSWTVKTRSGFAVQPGSGSDPGVRHGADYWLVASVGPLRIRSSTGRTGAGSPTGRSRGIPSQARRPSCCTATTAGSSG
jgi:uncharacterized protein (UPF0548 family)